MLFRFLFIVPVDRTLYSLVKYSPDVVSQYTSKFKNCIQGVIYTRYILYWTVIILDEFHTVITISRNPTLTAQVTT